ncbi:histidine kinase N-terminal 7TM domain-containing protein [Halobaculum sp. D14]|uniref:histidine kinase N-terminal 7TM domain-containing protein n=1 Tax=Halobaculum sp. D14 TaxID=3421642 RepID=UPI003EBFD801
MSSAVPWLAVGSLLSGAISVGFVRYLWPYRGKLGSRFFIATIACEALWSLSYGAALLVFDPALRRLFELPIWFAINFIGVFFLAFALEYTGRGRLLRSKLMGGVVLLQTAHTLVVATNPLHHVAWSNYHIEPVYGVATVAYTHQPWLFVNAAGFILMIAAASFLLVDTVISYGPLYRTQAAAIAVSPIFPGLPFLLWLVQVGGSPPLNLTPLVFPVHLAFDMYAFFSRDMFELVPASRRVADRAAIENLGSPVVIVDDGGRIIEFNGEARRVLGLDSGSALGRPLDDVLPEVDLRGDDQTVTRVVDGRRRVYAVTTASLNDSSGAAVGDTVVLQDITAERRREQRLSVLNRVLRHNLRNDLNVVSGNVQLAADRVDDEETRRFLETAESKTADLMALGEKARRIEQVVAADGEPPTAVSIRETAERIRDDLSEQYPAASIDVDVPEDREVLADSELLDQLFRNLVENALEHNPADRPSVQVELVADDESTLTVAVRDDGAGIPEHELAVLDTETESALEHGSGLGLWLVKWGVTSLGGSVRFEPSGEGTTVYVELPAADDDQEA